MRRRPKNRTRSKKALRPRHGWLWSHELAEAWAKGTAGRAAIEQHEKNLIAPFVQKAPSRRCEHVFNR